MEIRLVRAGLFHADGQMDRVTDRHDEANSRFVNASKSDKFTFSFYRNHGFENYVHLHWAEKTYLMF